MAESLDASVTRLLVASRAAHDLARMARSQKQTDSATRELREARDLRLEAHALDPSHTVALWTTERPTHAQMMDFYDRKVTA